MSEMDYRLMRAVSEGQKGQRGEREEESEKPSGACGEPEGDGGGLGVWGKVSPASVLFVSRNGMAVTRSRQALNALEAACPRWIGKIVRRFFDRLEIIAEFSADIYRLGTPFFEGFLGHLAENILRIMGKGDLIDKQYR